MSPSPRPLRYGWMVALCLAGTGGTGSTTGGVTDGLAGTGSDVPVAAPGTAAAVTVAAGAGVVFAMRRRRGEA